MNSSKYKHNELKKLGVLLHTKSTLIKSICEDPSNYYKEWEGEKKDTNTGLPKTYANGSKNVRIIRPSVSELRVLQTSIKKNVLSKVKFPTYIQGGVAGKNNISNAKQHQGKKYKFTTDLKNFFASVTNKKVLTVFLKLGFSNHAAHHLTKLTTWKGQLPLGTPTSPHLANLAFLSTDQDILRIIAPYEITYTRFVDDITLSSQEDFKSIIPRILNIIEANEFSVNYRKTQYSSNQMITGIHVFNNYIGAPAVIKEKAKMEANKDFKPYTNYLNAIKNTNKAKRSLS